MEPSNKQPPGAKRNRMITLTQATAVLAGNKFNPSIFQQLWVLENGILERDEFGTDSLYTPAAVNIINANFELLVIPERVQLVTRTAFEHMPEYLLRVIGSILDRLPHTPLRALGFNFEFLVEPHSQDQYAKTLRHLFVCEANPLAKEFLAEDSRFGMYLSKEMFDSRLRLNVTPISLNGKELLKLSFNVERNISRPEAAKELLPRWPEVFEYVNRITQLVDETMGAI